MAILRNKTQGDFTIIQNNILRDRRTSLKGRGVFTTLCGLLDNWSFSVEGLAKTMNDGKDSVRSGLKEMENLGYLRRIKRKNSRGRYETIVEIFPEGNAPVDPTDDYPGNKDSSPEGSDDALERETSDGCDGTETGFTVTENPPREIRHGETTTEKQPQYSTVNTINKSSNEIKECVKVKYTLGNQSLTSDDYDDLAREFGTELVEYQISRIISKPYG